MQLATWNVNSLGVRLPQVLDWLAAHPVDVLALQELKLTDDKFPAQAFADAGYQAQWFGQKTYNGVALISRTPAADVVKNIPGFADEQSRVLCATIDGVRVIGAYFPNGQAPGSDKFAYKMAWLTALREWVKAEMAAHPQLVRRIVDEGHLLGNHSQTHPRFGRLSLAGQLDEVARADAVLAPFDGRDRHAFRPPRGEMGWRMLWHCIRRRVPVAYWSYDSLDYARGDADALLATALRHPPRPGDVILMHDDGPLSLAYLQAMLPAWRAEGYRFEALPVHG